MKVQPPQNPQKILQFLLGGSIILATISWLIIYVDYQAPESDQSGLSLGMASLIVGFFISLYILNRYHYQKLAGGLFLSAYFLGNTYFIFRWGVEFPSGLLIYALLIIITGIIAGPIITLSFTALVATTLIIFTYAQAQGFSQPDLSWKTTPVAILDQIPAVIILFIILTVCWLYQQGMQKSLSAAQKATADLKTEKDLLEITITAKTEEIKQLQIKQNQQLTRLTELGRLTAGIYHDLLSPLTALKLNLSQIKKQLLPTNPYLSATLKATEKINAFLDLIRKQLQHQTTTNYFSANEEIEQVKQLLDYKIKKEQLIVKLTADKNYYLQGTAPKFSQIILNLLNNAIDAYDGASPLNKRLICINLQTNQLELEIIITDFGRGIKPIDLPHIFDSFFSTKQKNENNLGLGLAQTRQIIEQDFGGQITATSQLEVGTQLTIKLPLPYDKHQTHSSLNNF